MMRLLGEDPVHLTDAAYAAIAEHLVHFCENTVEEAKEAEAGSAAAKLSRPKPVRREPWIAASEPVAKQQHIAPPRGGGFGHRGPIRGQPHWRGGRGGHQVPKRAFKGHRRWHAPRGGHGGGY